MGVEEMLMAQSVMPSCHMLTGTEVTHANLYHCSKSLGLNGMCQLLNMQHGYPLDHSIQSG